MGGKQENKQKNRKGRQNEQQKTYQRTIMSKCRIKFNKNKVINLNSQSRLYLSIRIFL